MKISSANSIKGEINLPGDKSISHRAAIVSAMAEGETNITNFATSEDCSSTLNCLRDLGVAIEQNGTDVSIKGVGKSGFVKPTKPLDCGNSGTTMRLLAGVLAGQDFETVLVGDESLQSRPMKRIIEPLEQMGAKVESENGNAPLNIYSRKPLDSISCDLPVASAQIKSCVLLAGLNASGETKVKSPKSNAPVSPSRNHTELMLEFFGANINENFIESANFFTHEVSIDGGSALKAKDIYIPADISSGAFFIIAACCLDGSEVLLKNVGLNETRSAIINVLKGFGAKIAVENEREANKEIIGDLRVLGSSKLKPKGVTNKIDGDIIANLIDEVPILGVFGTQMENGLEIRNAAELRVKESDRIAAVCENLRRMNAVVEEFDDGFRVGKSVLEGAKVDSFGDHRIAMAFAIAGLFTNGDTEIIDADCAKVSFPEFFQVLENVVR